MKIHRDLTQRTWPWFTARAGKVTGSELGNLITDKGALRGWKTGMPNSYLDRKIVERWRGGPEQTFMGNQQTDQGNIWEPKARSYFSALLDREIEQVGGIESDDGKLWCSPDGLIGDDLGLEIKCPNASTHVGWLREGQQVPECHVLQCQFALYVTGWPVWQFLSFVNDMPHLAVLVERDEALFEVIGDALAEFQVRFEEGWKVMLERNGGPPPPRQTFIPSAGPIKFSWECDQNDIPT